MNESECPTLHPSTLARLRDAVVGPVAAPGDDGYEDARAATCPAPVPAPAFEYGRGGYSITRLPSSLNTQESA
jgi:hypothetical protein